MDANKLNHQLLLISNDLYWRGAGFRRPVCTAGPGSNCWAFFKTELELDWHERAKQLT